MAVRPGRSFITSWYPSNWYQYATNEWLDLAHLVKEQFRLVISFFFWPVMMTFEFAWGKPLLGADDYLLEAFSKDDIEEMLAKVKENSIKSEKVSKIWPVSGWSDRLEEAIHARLQADSLLTLKGIWPIAWFQSLLSKCDQEKIGTPSKNTNSRANEEGSPLASHDRFKDLWDRRSGWFLKIWTIFLNASFFKQLLGWTPRQKAKRRACMKRYPCWFSLVLLFFFILLGLIGSLFAIKRKFSNDPP